MHRDWQLIDGEQRSEQSARFEMPPFNERAALKPGVLVKIGVEGPPDDAHKFNGERFWVEIMDQDTSSGRYRGQVQNNLVMSNRHDIVYGSKIEFYPKHILQVHEAGY